MSFRFHTVRLFFASIATALLSACGSSGSGYGSSTGPVDPSPPVDAATVQATTSIQFTPPTVTLNVGGTVTFNFGALAHEVYFDNAPAGAPANIPAPTANTTLTRTFTTKGTYVYNCHIHPGMQGTVIVQ